MQVVIPCGGQGTRLREETEYRPKPMVPNGDRPHVHDESFLSTCVDGATGGNFAQLEVITASALFIE
jgi:UTP-glucose-1-phosphate uridylyltransferase